MNVSKMIKIGVYKLFLQIVLLHPHKKSAILVHHANGKVKHAYPPS
jgi:hypothetical protein